MKWLCDIAEKVDQVFQSIGTCYAKVFFFDTGCQDTCLICNSADNTAILWRTISIVIQGTVGRWTNCQQLKESI